MNNVFKKHTIYFETKGEKYQISSKFETTFNVSELKNLKHGMEKGIYSPIWDSLKVKILVLVGMKFLKLQLILQNSNVFGCICFQIIIIIVIMPTL